VRIVLVVALGAIIATPTAVAKAIVVALIVIALIIRPSLGIRAFLIVLVVILTGLVVVVLLLLLLFFLLGCSFLFAVAFLPLHFRRCHVVARRRGRCSRCIGHHCYCGVGGRRR
jgi:hypothetical protein